MKFTDEQYYDFFIDVMKSYTPFLPEEAQRTAWQQFQTKRSIIERVSEQLEQRRQGGYENLRNFVLQNIFVGPGHSQIELEEKLKRAEEENKTLREENEDLRRQLEDTIRETGRKSSK